MAGISSRIGNVAFAKQTVKGTAAVTPTVRYYLNGSPSLLPSKNLERFALTDSGRDQGNAYMAQVSVGGDIPIYAHPAGMALLNYAALGANADAGTTPNYTHTATPANDVPWLTIWRNVGDVLFEKFTDCKINSITYNGSAGGVWTATLNIIGLTADKLAADPVLAPITAQPYLYPESKSLIKFDTVAQLVDTVEFGISNNLAGYQADDFVFSDVDPGGREATMSFGTRFTGMSAFPDYQTFMYAAGSTLTTTVPANHAIDISMVRDANTSIQFLAPQVKYQPFSPQPDPGGDPLRLDMAVEVEKPSGGNICTLVTKDQAATV